jgi:hypothetical protein
MRLLEPPWSVGIADDLSPDSRLIIKTWVWCDRIQWMLITYLLLELLRWLNG